MRASSRSPEQYEVELPAIPFAGRLVIFRSAKPLRDAPEAALFIPVIAAAIADIVPAEHFDAPI